MTERIFPRQQAIMSKVNDGSTLKLTMFRSPGPALSGFYWEGDEQISAQIHGSSVAGLIKRGLLIRIETERNERHVTYKFVTPAKREE